MAVYLDHNATTPLHPAVLEAMLPYLRASAGANPSSPHAFGRAARAAVDRAREQVAALVGAEPRQVIFTGSGTEANNLAIGGVAGTWPGGSLVISAIEHSSVLNPARALGARGWGVHEVRPDADGRIGAEALAAAIGTDTRLVSVMWANNETGVLQDVGACAALAAERGAVFHTDAIQAAGRVAVTMTLPGIGLLSLSAHKIGGPQGIGALVAAPEVDLEPILRGGGQEAGRRSGTENVAGIVGFGEAAARAGAGVPGAEAGLGALRARLEEAILALPGAAVFGRGAERLANTVFFSVPGIDGETLLLLLDEAGYAVASGSACGSARPEPSHVLLAMGVDRELAHGALRVSLGPANTAADVDGFVSALHERVNVLRSMAV